MMRLIEAQRRGVNCVLMVDDLNNWVDHSLKVEFERNGGIIHSLNPIADFSKLMNKEFFRRHHEKLTVIDGKANIGSSNIADEYAGNKNELI
jgi:phosphatidylserine/phosphatidylglycerophosphate/cardiolipin synthase-like enzyme